MSGAADDWLAVFRSLGANARARAAWRIRCLGAACLAGVLFATSGCAALSLLCAPRLGRCSWIDLAPDQLVAVAQLQLRARVVGRGVDYRFPLVVESSPQALVVVGLTPLGTKAFSVKRDAERTRRESTLGPALPLDARNVAADVSALLVPSSCGNRGATAPADPLVEDGLTAHDFGRWRIEDLCRDGSLRERRISGPGASAVAVVHYEADEARIEHRRCGYEASYVVVAGALPGR